MALLLLVFSAPLYAFKSSSDSPSDIQRFGLNKILPKPPLLSAGVSSPIIYSYNHSRYPHHAVGVQSAGPASFSPIRPSVAAQSFLQAVGKNLNMNPNQLSLKRETSGLGHMHVLYQQTYQGLPVEFSHVKVHMDSSGAVLRVDSGFIPHIHISVSPSVPVQQAASAVAQDSGGTPVAPALVIFPDLVTRAPHLAWRFLVRRPQALWHYYVDARSGKILFRYDIFESGFSGNVQGMVYDIDPSQACSPGALPPCPGPRNFPHEWVYAGGPSNPAETDSSGNYSSTTNGELFTAFQGRYVNVASYFGANATYENEGGAWGSSPESLSYGPSPASSAGGIISSVTITIPASLNAIGFLPVFSNLNVGQNFSASGESFGITVDDELLILNPSGNQIGAYVGDLTPHSGVSFNGSMAVGSSLSVLVADQAQSPGGDSYSVIQSSYLVLSNPNVTGSNNNVVWASTMTPTGLEGELSLYYHLNLQHDFLSQVLGPLSSTLLNGTVGALAFFGPNMFNSFYDPQDDNLWFGDGGVFPVSQQGATPSPIDIMTDDATVPHHEFTHYLVGKIWPITNFGQSGAISEGNADFWSANSLNDPAIGLYVNGGTTNGPIRNLCGSSSDSLNGCGLYGGMHDYCRSSQPAIYSNSTWQGEIHCDGEFFSQSLWEFRDKEITHYNAANPGGSCTTPANMNPAPQANAQLNCPAIACISGLEMNALLFFPESFQEMEQALLDENATGAVSSCSFASQLQIKSDIIQSFSDHGISLCGSPQINPNDPYCNSGFETALDVSTISAVTATLYPAGEQDFYTFAASPGAIDITLNLSASTTYPGYDKGYQMTLLDSNQNTLVTAAPPFNGVNTYNGSCNPNDCETTASSVLLSYSSGGGRFFLEVTGGNDGNGSYSGASSLNPYSLSFNFPRVSAFTAGIVNATMNQDVISFQVAIASNAYLQTPQYSFAYAQLRDQSQNILQNSQTYPPSPSNYLNLVSSQSVNGQISGEVQIQNNFAARFPAVGTVYLEVFGYDVAGSTVSMGLSEALSLGTSQTDASAWNNVFDPMKGQQATIKYDVQSAGHLTITVYTMNGEKVSTILDAQVPAGSGSVNWAGANLRNATVSSGVYFIRVQGPGLSKILKAVVVK